MTPLLQVSDLVIRYAGPKGPAAVAGVDLTVGTREIFGLVGESGSGKSTLSMGVLGFLPASAVITQGSIRLDGRDLRAAGKAEWRQVRWRELAYVPQGAMNVLNPVQRVGAQFADMLRDHLGARLDAEWRERIAALLQSVRLKPDVLDRFPHELSGGMKQRVCIAMAILFEPKLIIADESTSALDVVSQRVVLQTLSAVRDRIGASIILIGHDLALQAQVADRVGIMFAGRFVEIGPVDTIFQAPRHPYTRLLIASVPSIRHRDGIPMLAEPTPQERAQWQAETEPLIEVGPGHLVAPRHAEEAR